MIKTATLCFVSCLIDKKKGNLMKVFVWKEFYSTKIKYFKVSFYFADSEDPKAYTYSNDIYLDVVKGVYYPQLHRERKIFTM